MKDAMIDTQAMAIGQLLKQMALARERSFYIDQRGSLFYIVIPEQWDLLVQYMKDMKFHRDSMRDSKDKRFNMTAMKIIEKKMAFPDLHIFGMPVLCDMRTLQLCVAIRP